MKKVKLAFGEFLFESEIIYGKIKNGVHFNQELNKILFENIIDYYGTDHFFAYVSIRENSYSIDPMVHYHNSQINLLTCFAVVEDPNKKNSTVEIESRFFKPNLLKKFSSKVNAVSWAKSQVKIAKDEVQS